jgi:hypothetical protein
MVGLSRRHRLPPPRRRPSSGPASPPSSPVLAQVVAAVTSAVATMDRCTCCNAVGVPLSAAVLAIREVGSNVVIPFVLCPDCLADPDRTQATVESRLASEELVPVGRWCPPTS